MHDNEAKLELWHGGQIVLQHPNKRTLTLFPIGSARMFNVLYIELKKVEERKAKENA